MSMQELNVANGESFNRDVEIKMVPFVLAHKQDEVKRNYYVRHILAQRAINRKNHLRWVSFWCAVAIIICSTLSMMTSLFYVLPALAGIGYVALFQHVNKEAFDAR
jgi:hypothetical protein